MPIKRKVLTLLMCLTLCIPMVSSLTTKEVKADILTQIELSTYYNQQMNSDYSSYLIPSQPHSALVLQDTVALFANHLSPNYRGGVVDLPRLSEQYYYALSSTTSGFELAMYTYPTLLFSEASKGATVKLYIKSESTNATLKEFTISNTNDLHGWDYYYTGADVYDDNGQLIFYAAELEDCSSHIMEEFVAGKCIKKDIPTTYYNSELHKSSIVMPKYLYTTESDYTDYVYNITSDVPYDPNTDTFDIGSEAYPFMRQVISTRAVTTSYNVKDYLGTMNQGTSLSPSFLVIGSKYTDDCYYDSNTGEVKTETELSDQNTELYYAIALTDKCYFGKILKDTIDSDAYTTVEGTENMRWEADGIYDLESAVIATPREEPYADITYGGFKSADVSPLNYIYGPISFDKFWASAAENYNVTTMQGKYSFLHTNEENDIKDVNIYAESLIYAGCLPHLANATLVKRPETVEINYYYQNPDSTIWTFGGSKSYEVSDFTIGDLITLPTKEYYTATGWYVDDKLTKEFTLSDIPDDTGEAINLYAKYNYTGGTYKVTFYNDVTKVTLDEKEFRINELPSTSETPRGTNGYLFRNWMIVDDIDDELGSMYLPETFNPVAGSEYVFKTTWDIAGVIQHVNTAKTNYFIGEEIDKSTLEVVVQNSNDVNDTRILSPTEFTLSNAKVTTEGVHNVWVTYTATGSIGRCEVKGIPVKATGITVSYLGGNLEIGTTLTENHFTVKQNYNNGESERVGGYKIVPNSIKMEGTNKIKITYGSFSEEVQITGYVKGTSSGSSGSSEETPVVKSLTVSYVGDKLYAGDTIKASDLSVVAKYSDNTTKTLSASDYTYTPSYLSYAGTVTIRVKHAGLLATTKVTVNAKSSSGSGSTSNSDSDDSSNNDDDDSSTGNKSENGKDSDDKKSNSKNQNSDGSTNTNDGKESDKDSSDNNSKDKGTSPGYLSGANILTNVAGVANATSKSDVDIKEAVENASVSATSVSVTLVNGLAGNDITPDVMKMLQDKVLTLNVTMVSASDKSTTVGTWEIHGSELDNTSNINPNITFETVAKETDTVLFVTPQLQEYPKGVTLEVKPEVSTYNSGELVTMYTTDLSKSDSKFLKSIVWEDAPFTFDVNVYESKRYAFSNITSPYADGSNLMTESENISVSENTIDDTTTGGLGVYTSTDEYVEEEFDWGTDDENVNIEVPTMLDEDFNSLSSKLTTVVIIVTLLLLLGSVGIVLLFCKLRPSDVSYADFSENDNVELEDFTEEIGDDF